VTRCGLASGSSFAPPKWIEGSISSRHTVCTPATDTLCVGGFQNGGFHLRGLRGNV
jgi:hypothetical protein